MTHFRTAAFGIAALAAAAFTPMGAQAQGVADARCNGRLFIDALYTTSVGPGGANYDIAIQNRSPERRRYRLTFLNFPPEVVVFERNERYAPLKAYEQRYQGVYHVNGPNALNFGTGHVTIAYDAPRGSGPTILVSECARE